jgi:hypothetical protein
MAEGKLFKDPKTYREMCVPFESADVAEKAITAFFEEVREVRIKHKMPDVLLVVSLSWMSEGEELPTMALVHNGDSNKAEGMAAFALGHESARREEATAYMRKAGAKVSVKS